MIVFNHLSKKTKTPMTDVFEEIQKWATFECDREKTNFQEYPGTCSKKAVTIMNFLDKLKSSHPLYIFSKTGILPLSSQRQTLTNLAQNL